VLAGCSDQPFHVGAAGIEFAPGLGRNEKLVQQFAG